MARVHPELVLISIQKNWMNERMKKEHRNNNNSNEFLFCIHRDACFICAVSTRLHHTSTSFWTSLMVLRYFKKKTIRTILNRQANMGITTEAYKYFNTQRSNPIRYDTICYNMIVIPMRCGWEILNIWIDSRSHSERKNE